MFTVCQVVNIIDCPYQHRVMPPKGLKATSSPIQVSAAVAETSLNAYATTELELTLNALDNEVFVITQVNIDVDAPDVRTSTTFCAATLSATPRATLGGINDSNVIAQAQRIIVTDGTSADTATPFDREDPLFSAQEMDYLYIVATNNMHLNFQGDNNANKKGARVRVYGYRARADAPIYAALVQSELLSS